MPAGYPSGGIKSLATIRAGRPYDILDSTPLKQVEEQLKLWENGVHFKRGEYDDVRVEHGWHRYGYA